MTQAHLNAFAAALEAKVATKPAEETEDVHMYSDVMNRVEQLEMQVQQLAQAQSRQTAETQAISSSVWPRCCWGLGR